MSELIEDALKKRLLQDIDGTNFYVRRHRNGQDTDKLASEMKRLIAEHGLSVSEAKGFCEYMKIIIDICSYPHFEK